VEFERLLISYETGPGKGLPIGSLTSQHWANSKDFPYINQTRHGMDVLGCRVWPGYSTLNRLEPREPGRQLEQ
jgi:hypothetical protein